MSSISLRKQRENKKGNSLVYFDYQNVNYLMFARTIISTTARASSVKSLQITRPTLLIYNCAFSSRVGKPLERAVFCLNGILINCLSLPPQL